MSFPLVNFIIAIIVLTVILVFSISGLIYINTHPKNFVPIGPTGPTGHCCSHKKSKKEILFPHEIRNQKLIQKHRQNNNTNYR